MNEAALSPDHLIHRLPAVRGSYTPDARLGKITWFRVGGPVDVLFTPADQEDLVCFMQNKPADLPVMVIGVGSNLLVRDSGVSGVVIRLGPAFAQVVSDGNLVVCGAAALDVKVAKTALKAGLTGLEFLCGVPGTIGGALRMNAGAYGRETKDILVWAEAMDPQGKIHRLTAEQLGFEYRHCALASDWIFLSACFAGSPGDPEAIARQMKEIQNARGSSQPIKSRTGGSTFKNPEGYKAWELVDQAGCRGMKIGDAQVSEQHCNFLINTDKATARDLEELGETVRRKVKETSGVELQWEIKRIGEITTRNQKS
ncbi:UDP-N-acetylmuramate dehydrogenase [Kiloniella laminariae]|uniref:UDP-N-acetylenolpyruvoylglucosamine reductase n=1 Tax=Kiloniella laminariae TaxID=454162 RepID=A0ABT4LDX3_9PROT|nr:UDP-N-acetylmuramate dehydrogenase [Kiloniella laminariae]MCZ4279291.1 UDP-N-acetylmuramate dehydrogenase [Kiloniella laminariae]